MAWKRETSWSWSNWTFGYWSWRTKSVFGNKRVRGFDLGPFEVVWRDEKKEKDSLNRPASQREMTTFREGRGGEIIQHPSSTPHKSELRTAPQRTRSGLRMRGRKPVLREVSPFAPESDKAPRPDLTGRQADLAALKADQERLRGDWV